MGNVFVCENSDNAREDLRQIRRSQAVLERKLDAMQAQIARLIDATSPEEEFKLMEDRPPPATTAHNARITDSLDDSSLGLKKKLEIPRAVEQGRPGTAQSAVESDVDKSRAGRVSLVPFNPKFKENSVKQPWDDVKAIPLDGLFPQTDYEIPNAFDHLGSGRILPSKFDAEYLPETQAPGWLANLTQDDGIRHQFTDMREACVTVDFNAEFLGMGYIWFQDERQKKLVRLNFDSGCAFGAAPIDACPPDTQWGGIRPAHFAAGYEDVAADSVMYLEVIGLYRGRAYQDIASLRGRPPAFPQNFCPVVRVPMTITRSERAVDATFIRNGQLTVESVHEVLVGCFCMRALHLAIDLPANTIFHSASSGTHSAILEQMCSVQSPP